jgi:stage II sporulation protein R
MVAAAVASAAWLWRCEESAASAAHPGGLIRFHVIANSDSPADQVLKIKVRDEVIRAMAPVLAGADDAEGAGNRVDENIDLIAGAAARVLAENGCYYPVRVAHGIYNFPQKTYRVNSESQGTAADLTLPAGAYEAVRVVIGSGRGANWWCVLFPPLCFVNPADAEAGEEKAGEEKAGVEGEKENYRGDAGESEKNPARVPAFRYDQINPEAAGRPAVEYRLKLVEWFRCLKGV